MQEDRQVVLVVDDEVHILYVVCLKLRDAGFEVITAEDGKEALRIARELSPDLIITDHHMPYLSGVDFCVHLKQHQETTDIPVMMLTARGVQLTDELLDGTNIECVLTKPFSPRELLLHVQELTGQPAAGGDAQSQ